MNLIDRLRKGRATVDGRLFFWILPENRFISYRAQLAGPAQIAGDGLSHFWQDHRHGSPWSPVYWTMDTYKDQAYHCLDDCVFNDEIGRHALRNIFELRVAWERKR